MAQTKIDDLLSDIAAGTTHPVYLVTGDLVVAEPQALRLAEALAEKAGCEVESYRRPASLGPILADLKTFSLFTSAKVTLVTHSALLADKSAAAELVDEAAEALPVAEGDLTVAGREAASRLLQTLRLFGVKTDAAPAEVIEALPKWAFEGGPKRRKRSKKRLAKEIKKLKKELEPLLEAALEAGLQGFAEGDLAELGAVVSGGLPPGHALVLAESAATKDHPIYTALEQAGTTVALGTVTVDRRGDWQGLEPLVEELVEELGVRVARDAVTELARRTLRQTGDFKAKSVDAESTSRFAAELRKLADIAGGGRITRQMVAATVEDRGEQDVWQILDAIGRGQGHLAIENLRRYLAAADDVVGARLSFFAVLVRFCRQLTAVAGLVKLCGVPWTERNYNRFKERLAPKLTGELPHGGNPLAGSHPFQVFRAYQTAAGIAPDDLARLPAWILETELRLKGDSTNADTALYELMARLVKLIRP